MEARSYYICTVSRNNDGKLAAVSFRLPIAKVGQRIWYRMLFQPDKPTGAPKLAAAIRADPKEFLRELGGGTSDSSLRLVGVQAVAGFVVVTVSGIRRS